MTNLRNQAEYVATHIISTLQNLSDDKFIEAHSLQPSACSDNVFDLAIKIARQSITITSRIYDGDLYFRGNQSPEPHDTDGSMPTEEDHERAAERATDY